MLLLTGGHAALRLAQHQLSLEWIGANPTPAGAGEGLAPWKQNVFYGSDPSKWCAGKDVYERVRYRDLYPGIDLIYKGRQDGSF